MNLREFASVLTVVWACTIVCGSCDDSAYPEYPCCLEDGKLNMTQLATKYGYPIEPHKVQTEDGYILTMYRIPHGRKCGPNGKTKVPVLVQHGLLSSSYDFLITGPKRALGYLLADDCYDVWLGNNRGNIESMKHISMNSTEKEFWNFSWSEMGKYDLPAMIDYILKVTGEPSIHYVAHSQGTTQFFVLGALRPEYQKKIRSMHALSPVVYMKNLKSPIINFFLQFMNPLEKLFEVLGVKEIFASNTLLNILGIEICQDKYPELQSICYNVMFLMCGFDEPQLNKTILPAIIGHTPSGSAVKQIIHYGQEIKSGEFREYDYGVWKNLKIYNNIFPPRYDLKKIKVPIALYYGANDFLAALVDVKKVEQQLPNVIEKYLVPYSKFGHLDFLFATDVKPLLYNRVMELLKKL